MNSSQKKLENSIRNIALYYVKSNIKEPEELDHVRNGEIKAELPEEKYRKEFNKYRKANMWYDKRILPIVTRISETILQESLDSVVQELAQELHNRNLKKKRNKKLSL